MWEDLVPVVNRIQEILFQARETRSVHQNDGFTGKVKVGGISLDLPQIAVVGSQSVGKSSLLESIVGREFLPRGNGMVTKCPLILQLRNCRTDVPEQEWGEFSHLPNMKFLDFNRIRTEISRRQEELVSHTAQESSAKSKGPSNSSNDNNNNRNPTSTKWTQLLTLSASSSDASNSASSLPENGGVANGGSSELAKTRAVCSTPILLKLFSPDFVDITLVDLPGLIRVPSEDQPEDIDRMVRQLILEYIASPSCIILAVSAANVDLANSDALEIARLVDPLAQRTVGALSKCDCVEDADAAILPVMNGSLYALPLGYTAVRCRSQRETDAGVTLKAALEAESKFFAGNPSLASLANQTGIARLTKKLQSILVKHIRESLPRLKDSLERMCHSVENSIAELGQPLCPDGPNGAAVLLTILNDFATEFEEALDGRRISRSSTWGFSSTMSPRNGGLSDSNGTKMTATMSKDGLVGGARLNFMFHNWFSHQLLSFAPLEGLQDFEIRNILRNTTGPSGSLFLPEAAFEILVRRQIKELEQPCLQCVDQIHHELICMVDSISSPRLCQAVALRQEIMSVAKELIKSSYLPTKQFVSHLIQVEFSMINKNHPEFAEGRTAIVGLVASSSSSSSSAAQRNLPPFLPPRVPNTTSNADRSTTASNQDSRGGGNTAGNGGLVLPFSNPSSSSLSDPAGVSSSDEIGVASHQHPNQQQQARGGGGKRQSLSSGTAGGDLGPPSPSPFPIGGPGSLSLAAKGVPGFTFWRKNNQMQSPAAEQYAGGGEGKLGDENSGAMVGSDDVELNIVKILVASYVQIVKKTLADLVPKSIMCFMVLATKNQLQQELVTRLYKEELFANLLKEDDETAQRRQVLKIDLQTLKDASNVLNQFNLGKHAC